MRGIAVRSFAIASLFGDLIRKELLTHEERLKNKIDKPKDQKALTDPDVDRHVGVGHYQQVLRRGIQLRL